MPIGIIIILILAVILILSGGLLVLWVVDFVAKDWATNIVHMNTELVSATSFWPELDKR